MEPKLPKRLVCGRLKVVLLLLLGAAVNTPNVDCAGGAAELNRPVLDELNRPDPVAADPKPFGLLLFWPNRPEAPRLGKEEVAPVPNRLGAGDVAVGCVPKRALLKALGAAAAGAEPKGLAGVEAELPNRPEPKVLGVLEEAPIKSRKRSRSGRAKRIARGRGAEATRREGGRSR